MTARRVLVVDDDVDNADGVAALLRTGGVEVRVAYSGAEGLAIGVKFVPDVILLDLVMPVMDGFETARRIRRAAWGPRVVLVAITGWAHGRERAQAAGFDHAFLKPIDWPHVAKLLGIWLPPGASLR